MARRQIPVSKPKNGHQLKNCLFFPVRGQNPDFLTIFFKTLGGMLIAWVLLGGLVFCSLDLDGLWLEFYPLVLINTNLGAKA